jgi:hypothetical protein
MNYYVDLEEECEEELDELLKANAKLETWCFWLATVALIAVGGLVILAVTR